MSLPLCELLCKGQCLQSFELQELSYHMVNKVSIQSSQPYRHVRTLESQTDKLENLSCGLGDTYCYLAM